MLKRADELKPGDVTTNGTVRHTSLQVQVIFGGGTRAVYVPDAVFEVREPTVTITLPRSVAKEYAGYPNTGYARTRVLAAACREALA